MESRYVEDAVQGSLVSQHRLRIFSQRCLRWNGRRIKLGKSDGGEGCSLRDQRPGRARSGFAALVAESCFLSWADSYG